VSTPPVHPEGGVPFPDAHGAREWLGALPLTNIPLAQSQVLDAIVALNRAGFAPLERLKTLELARDKVAFLQGEQRSRYFGKTLPLSANDSAAWNTGRLLLEEMETGYRRCLEDAGDGGEIHAHRALIVHRIMRYVGAQMAFHATIYRRFDPQLWTRLHATLADAEASGIASDRVKDSLDSEDKGSCVMEAYAQVVMLQAAYLSELTAPQMDLVEALLRRWARRVTVHTPALAPAQAARAYPLAVDLAKPIGARPLAAGEATPLHRVLDVDGVSKSIRKRLHGFSKGEDAARLDLPREATSVDAEEQLQRLHKLWCEGAPPRPPAKIPAEKTAGLVWGILDIHFFLSGGKPFEQPGETRELTSVEKQEMEVFGRVRERTHGKLITPHTFVAEPWAVVDEMLGAWRLMRPSTASKGVAIGRIAAMRLGDTAPFYVGMVTALSQELDGAIVATLTLFPGRPEPVAARPGEPRTRAAQQWTPALRLPALERLRIAPSLVVASGLASRGRTLEVWGEQRHALPVRELLDRGTDFDRVVVG